MTATEPVSAMPCSPRSDSYPPWVVSGSDRHRWDLAIAIAAELFAGDGPAAIWSATRSIYSNPNLPTGELHERADERCERPPIPMPVNEPGDYLEAPNLFYASEIEDPEERAKVEAELVERRELRGGAGHPSE